MQFEELLQRKLHWLKHRHRNVTERQSNLINFVVFLLLLFRYNICFLFVNNSYSCDVFKCVWSTRIINPTEQNGWFETSSLRLCWRLRLKPRWTTRICCAHICENISYPMYISGAVQYCIENQRVHAHSVHTPTNTYTQPRVRGWYGNDI